MQWTDRLQTALDRIDAGDPAQAELICRQLLHNDNTNHAVLLLLRECNRRSRQETDTHTL